MTATAPQATSLAPYWTHGNPRLLDLFCGAGGAAAGYHRAGFDVVGVDVELQPRYPFTFLEYDALLVLKGLASDGEFSWLRLRDFDAIHASPPCQDYSRAMKCFVADGQYPRLIEPVRELLVEIGLPWVIENVPGAPLPTQADLFGANGIELCGTMFGLRVWRHRLFEASFPVAAPRGCDHSLQPMNPHKAPTRRLWRAILPAGESVEGAWRAEMGVGWMSAHEGREAIPPAYTEYVGRNLMASMVGRAL
jgi:DNA (cytosine-5)-methyltransferase 1